jgi:hypothetical protein
MLAFRVNGPPTWSNRATETNIQYAIGQSTSSTRQHRARRTALDGADYRSAVDREAIARGERRRRIEEALDEERGREDALVERLQEVVTEGEGNRIDEQAFARMDPEDVALVRELLEEPSAFDEGDEQADFLALERDEEDQTETEEEIARLQAEIAASRRRRLAYERYLAALDS